MSIVSPFLVLLAGINVIPIRVKVTETLREQVWYVACVLLQVNLSVLSFPLPALGSDSCFFSVACASAYPLSFLYAA